MLQIKTYSYSNRYELYSHKRDTILEIVMAIPKKPIIIQTSVNEIYFVTYKEEVEV